jgi:hypothetical protein
MAAASGVLKEFGHQQLATERSGPSLALSGHLTLHESSVFGLYFDINPAVSVNG